MDAIALLKADHKTVEALFKKYEKLQKKGGTPREKKKVVGQIVKELSVHAAVEEELFYPAVKQADEKLGDTIYESLEEHHLVKFTLDELGKMAASNERYDAKVNVLMESTRHHVQEEEQEMFPEVRKAMARKALTALAADMAKLKKKVPRKPHPFTPDEPPANKVMNRSAKAIEKIRDEAPLKRTRARTKQS